MILFHDLGKLTEKWKIIIEKEKRDDQDYYGGWLMVENIKDYMDNLFKNRRFVELRTELDRWIEVLKKEYNPEMILLFGSFAQRKVKSWSDIDLLIVKSTDKPFLDRIKDVILILRPKTGLDVIVYTPSFCPIIRSSSLILLSYSHNATS